MKIYYSIIIGFILICCLSFTTKYLASTWAGTASNQTVSQSALADAVSLGLFEPVTTVPTGTKQLTKSEIAGYVYMANIGTYASKASNQLVVKGEMYAGDPPSATLTIQFYSGQWVAILSRRIYSTTIQIYGHSVNGYGTTDCTGGAIEGGTAATLTTWDKVSGVTETVLPLQIEAGSMTGIQVVGGMSCSSLTYKLRPVGYVINGVSRDNGDVFTIGGTTVTLVITNTVCSYYPC